MSEHIKQSILQGMKRANAASTLQADVLKMCESASNITTLFSKVKTYHKIALQAIKSVKEVAPDLLQEAENSINKVIETSQVHPSDWAELQNKMQREISRKGKAAGLFPWWATLLSILGGILVIVVGFLLLVLLIGLIGRLFRYYSSTGLYYGFSGLFMLGIGFASIGGFRTSLAERRISHALAQNPKDLAAYFASKAAFSLAGADYSKNGDKYQLSVYSTYDGLSFAVSTLVIEAPDKLPELITAIDQAIADEGKSSVQAPG